MRLYIKKTNKKCPTWQEFQTFKKEIGLYGKCPNCGDILQEFDSEWLAS